MDETLFFQEKKSAESEEAEKDFACACISTLQMPALSFDRALLSLQKTFFPGRVMRDKTGTLQAEADTANRTEAQGVLMQAENIPLSSGESFDFQAFVEQLTQGLEDAAQAGWEGVHDL